MKYCNTHAYTMENEANIKPMKMRLTGSKSILNLRSRGYTTTKGYQWLANGFLRSSRLCLGLTIEKRYENAQSDRVEILEEVVGRAMKCHGTSL